MDGARSEIDASGSDEEKKRPKRSKLSFSPLHHSILTFSRSIEGSHRQVREQISPQSDLWRMLPKPVRQPLWSNLAAESLSTPEALHSSARRKRREKVREMHAPSPLPQCRTSWPSSPFPSMATQGKFRSPFRSNMSSSTRSRAANLRRRTWRMPIE